MRRPHPPCHSYISSTEVIANDSSNLPLSDGTVKPRLLGSVCTLGPQKQTHSEGYATYYPSYPSICVLTNAPLETASIPPIPIPRLTRLPTFGHFTYSASAILSRAGWR